MNIGKCDSLVRRDQIRSACHAEAERRRACHAEVLAKAGAEAKGARNWKDASRNCGIPTIYEAFYVYVYPQAWVLVSADRRPSRGALAAEIAEPSAKS